MGALSSTMDIRHSAGPLVTGILISSTGFMSGFFKSFLLAAGVSVVFAISIKDKKIVRSPGNGSFELSLCYCMAGQGPINGLPVSCRLGDVHVNRE